MATFTLYLPDRLLPLLDEARGTITRSGWIRLAVENQLADRETVQLVGAGPGGEPLDEQEDQTREAHRSPTRPQPNRSPRSKPKTESQVPEEIPLPKVAKRHWG